MQKQLTPTEAADEQETIAVVGIGVCALSLRSFEQVFADIDPELGTAYLVAVRQQEGLMSAPSLRC
ncbi:hypothetical protein GCM10016234_00680 [Tianweitania populi]|uniref:Uncharacterized protein n=1 Tax=Tianweitania populi TaxID=1607949 RepID=A0A8J3GIK5_9HYPH|nr:hypothetical protein GCM10016234_00680 [Tianweitania populi]